MRAIYFDMDGTIANLYGVENWLAHLEAEEVTPYICAKPLCNMSLLARYLNKLQQSGYHIGIVSWTSKCGTEEYNEAVVEAKMKWLATHTYRACVSMSVRLLSMAQASGRLWNIPKVFCLMMKLVTGKSGRWVMALLSMWTIFWQF